MQETPQQYTARMLAHTKDHPDMRDALRLQQATPKRLAALVKGKTKQQLARRPAPGKWSVAEILAHLADAEIAISWRLRQILSTDGIALQAFDQDSWAAAFDYAHRDPKLSLAHFRALREANVALLKAAPQKAWENHGMHAERGKETIAHMARMAAGHDQNHLGQIENILKGKR
jgi:hypothetical protein